MADYHTPTVIQPDVPIADITPLERLILSHMFEEDGEDDHLYYSSQLGAEIRPVIDGETLSDAFERSRDFDSRINTPIADLLAEFAPDEHSEIDVDLVDLFEDLPQLIILQDIVRRSLSVEFFTIVSAYTCTKMRIDGFGGAATLIMDDKIFFQTTGDMIEQWIDQEKLGRG